MCTTLSKLYTNQNETRGIPVRVLNTEHCHFSHVQMWICHVASCVGEVRLKCVGEVRLKCVKVSFKVRLRCVWNAPEVLQAA